MSRYARAGWLYDIVSLEPLLYRRPRARLMQLLGPLPGATVVDMGCGTGLNLPHLQQLVGPAGMVIGIDESESMMRAARRRVDRAGWPNVELARHDAAAALSIVQTSHSQPIDAVVATFVLSLLPDEGRFWSSIDDLSARRPVRLAVADLGEPLDAPKLARPALRALTAAGGGNPTRRSWEQLARRAPDTIHETVLGGHVHLAVGTCAAGAAPIEDGQAGS